jgi:hypothetical protein
MRFEETITTAIFSFNPQVQLVAIMAVATV